MHIYICMSVCTAQLLTFFGCLQILSVSKALSVQAHPDKALAEALHARNPSAYPDGNHKPEMAIALTPFTAMVGFRSIAGIAHAVEHCPELRAVIGDKGMDLCKCVRVVCVQRVDLCSHTCRCKREPPRYWASE